MLHMVVLQSVIYYFYSRITDVIKIVLDVLSTLAVSIADSSVSTIIKLVSGYLRSPRMTEFMVDSRLKRIACQ